MNKSQGICLCRLPPSFVLKGTGRAHVAFKLPLDEHVVGCWSVAETGLNKSHGIWLCRLPRALLLKGTERVPGRVRVSFDRACGRPRATAPTNITEIQLPILKGTTNFSAA